MIILGIETSCDETAAAVVADGGRILSSVVASQIEVFTIDMAGWCRSWHPGSTWRPSPR